MKLVFEADQPFQLEAVAAVADLFQGQGPGVLGGPEAANPPLADPERLRRRLREVQRRHGIAVPDPEAAPCGWDLVDPGTGALRRCPHLSVEMETGTGKTYVYLRTIHELARRHGYRKFVIVVPGVAVREGVLQALEATREHFLELYGPAPAEHSVYRARDLGRLRQFALDGGLQILVINIDAFRKTAAGGAGAAAGNVIYREDDRLAGRPAIEFVQAARPIVIIDEPQSVDGTERAQAAIRALNPLCTLRYSATHRNRYDLVYRLDPARAFQLRLVKQVVVASSCATDTADSAFVRAERIEHRPAIRARLRILRETPRGAQERSVRVRRGDDLYALSGGRPCYREGWTVAAIDAAPGRAALRFANGQELREGEEVGGSRGAVWRAQVRRTVERHLQKELQVRGRGIKVLTLFFIDRVANYRDRDAAGRAVPGRLARVLEEILAGLREDPRYRGLDWLAEPAERLHAGYFAVDRQGRPRDTGGATPADDDAYALIMRDKERLLSLAEPLRFIFSHSALREGWDNPNVFQICILNEVRSPLRRRQEIGRGLRLPVDQEGRRVRDDEINQLYVMAGEGYEAFARGLQAEYAADGAGFGSRAGLARHVRPEAAGPCREDVLDPRFRAAWGRIPPRTTFRVAFATDDLVADALEAFRRLPPVPAPRIRTVAGRLRVDASGVAGSLLEADDEALAAAPRPVPDLLSRLQEATGLTRATLARILEGCGRLEACLADPDRFLDEASRLLQAALRRRLGGGVRLRPVAGAGPGGPWEMVLLGPDDLAPVPESAFRVALPAWFEVATPVGPFHPDWAQVDPAEGTVCLVRGRGPGPESTERVCGPGNG